MCQTKSWTSLYINKCYKGGNNVVIVIATRSDKVIISLSIKFPDKLSGTTATDITAEAIEKLETYRNCNCGNDKKCPYHINQEKENN